MATILKQYNNYPRYRLQRQCGAVMVVSLVLLTVLTLVGITSSQFSALEEKMAGNMRDYNIALQAAEAGIRDAEQDISNQLIPNYRLCKKYGFQTNCGFSTASTSDDGLCTNYGGYSPDVRTALTSGFCPTPHPSANIAVVCLPAIPDPFNGPPSVAYGTFTGARPLPQVSAQPRYLIEAYDGKYNGQDFWYYRITVKAQGLNPATVVWLHSVYRIPPHNNC